MFLIFAFSSQQHNASTAQSTSIIHIVHQVFGVAAPEAIIRKGAHAVLYFVLGLLVVNMVVTQKRSLQFSLIASEMIVIIYAMTDEFHQLFVSGRAGLWGDVLLDSTAGLLGVIMLIFIFRTQLYKKAKVI
jgi:VanZ family protein